MHALQQKRELLKYKRREIELQKEVEHKFKLAIQETEKELQVRVGALRNEAKNRLEKVDRFKEELKERIDALCRCYEEVSVRSLSVSNAFKEAEDKLVLEAKRSVEAEKKRLETAMIGELSSMQDQIE